MVAMVNFMVIVYSDVIAQMLLQEAEAGVEAVLCCGCQTTVNDKTTASYTILELRMRVATKSHLLAVLNTLASYTATP